MASFHQTILIGYLGSDPEVRNTPNALVATFRVACTDTWTDRSGDRQESTEWYTVVAWKNLAERVQRFLRKGSQVHVVGKMKTRSWEDKRGGGKRSVQEVQCQDFLLLGPTHPDPARDPHPPRDTQPQSPEYTEDDLPF